MLATGKVNVYAGRRHPLEQVRTFLLARIMVEQYKVSPTQAVLDSLKATVGKYDPDYKSYYDEKIRILNYLKVVGLVLEKENFSASLEGKDTTLKSFEPFDVNDPQRKKTLKKKTDNINGRKRPR